MLAAPLGRILTLDNLRKMNVIVVDWSYMCKMSGESIDLLHCEVARELWVSIFCLSGVELVMPGKVIELLASWRGEVESRNILEVWRMTHL
jgi:hypothetical protein